MRALLLRFREAKWTQTELLNQVLDIGSLSLALSATGVERLKTLHSILVGELGELSYGEYVVLVRLLAYCREKYYPEGEGSQPESR